MHDPSGEPIQGGGPLCLREQLIESRLICGKETRLSRLQSRSAERPRLRSRQHRCQVLTQTLLIVLIC